MSGQQPSASGGAAAHPTSTLALRGAKWSSIGVGAQRAVQTGAIIVLARLLTPEDFGLVAVAVIFLTIANRVKSLGLHTALIQYRGALAPAADTCFVLNGGLTVAALLLIAAASPLASGWFGDPRAGLVLAVMSLRLLPQAATAIPTTLAVRELNFRKQTMIQLADSLVNAAVAIILAARGWGVWALVAGSLAGPTLAAVLWWMPPPWRVRLRIDRDACRHLLHSGIRIWSSGNLAFVIDSANRLFIGGFLGVARLGFYEVTSRLVHTPLQSLLGTHDRVAIPSFCREQEDRRTVARWFLRLTTFLVLLTAAGAGALLFYSDLIVPLVLGARWKPVGRYLQVLAPHALLMPLLFTAPIYIATDRIELLLRFTAVRTTVTIAALFVAAQFSLLAVCTVESATTALFVPVNVALIMRAIDIKLRDVLSALVPPAAGLVGFSAAAAALRPAAAWLGRSNSLIEAASIVPAYLVFAACVAVVRPRVLTEGWKVLVVALGVTPQPRDDSTHPARRGPS